MSDSLWASYFAIIVVVLVLHSPARSEMKKETEEQRTLVLELRNMISNLFDKVNVTEESFTVTETEEEDKKQRGRKSVDEDIPVNNKKAHADKLRKEGIDDVTLLPLYPCDAFDEGGRACTNVRQIGTTLTLGVHVLGGGKRHRIRWFRFFKVRDSDADIKEELSIERKPWNINLGEDNTELRISPISETDYSHNYFVAFLVAEQKPDKLADLRYLKFYIQPLPIDMGTLYHGEELFISVRSFIELPGDSVRFSWRQSDPDPSNSLLLGNSRRVSSNMKRNADGSVLVIKEFMDSTDRVISCDVYSNKDVFVARRDFLLRKTAEPGESPDDLEREVAHERKRRSLQENYDYLLYSDKDELESDDDSYVPGDDINVVDVDSSDTTRNSRKSSSDRFSVKRPNHNTQDLQFIQYYRMPTAYAYRGHSPIASHFGKQSPSVLTYNEQPSQTLDRRAANLPGILNERSSVYNARDSQYQTLFRKSSAPTFDEQPTYSKQPQGAHVHGDQSPSELAYGEQPIAATYSKQLQGPYTYGKQSPSELAYGEQIAATYRKQSQSENTYGDQPRSVFAYRAQPPSESIYGKQPPSAPIYSQQQPSAFTYERQPEPAMLKSPILKTLIKQANSLAHGEQPIADSYRKQAKIAHVYGDQPPSSLAYGEQPIAYTYSKQARIAHPRSAYPNGEQPPIEAEYGEQPPIASVYSKQPPSPDERQPDSTMLKSPFMKTLIKQANSLAHGEQPIADSYREQEKIAHVYGDQPPSKLAYGEQPIAYTYSKQARIARPRSANLYGEQPPKETEYGEQPPSASVYSKQPPSPNETPPDSPMLKPPFMKTLIQQANSLARLSPTPKSVDLQKVDPEPQRILTFDDMESRLISSCRLDSECGIHAFCYGGVNAQTAVFEPMFCRCKNDYVGNGIFCWLF